MHQPPLLSPPALALPPDYRIAPSAEWSSERQAKNGKEKVNLWLKVQF